MRLPERISADDLNRLLIDQPGSFELIDIRPPEQFNDYSIQGSRNVTIGEVVNSGQILQGTSALILVDRDGSLAMAVGGIVAQRTQRPVKVLYGGLEAYWEEIELRSVLRRGGGVAAAPEQPAEPQEGAPASQTPSPPGRRGLAPRPAGC